MASTSTSSLSSGYGTLSKNSTVKNMSKQQNSVFGSSTMCNEMAIVIIRVYLQALKSAA
ncbi:hypothetical protein LOAG_03402 [Loa loa]|uniref:Uncharacterized protein n=1 Tax=Loa loa TaxID=7209 RepID=A0A1S0U481_LOALO|nr:hypothetical protein LOAG_03402 [Loa loa]EFO25080.1 hypothetical protein LOAG_03402 [Loa loa]